MRKSLVGPAVLLTVGTAFGTASFSITGPGGVSTYEPAPGEVFPITIYLATDAPIVSWRMTLDGPPGYMLAAFPGYPIVYGNDPIWKIPELPPWSPTNPSPFPVDIGGMVADIITPSFGGAVFYANVIAPSVITTGMIFGTDAFVGDAGFNEYPAPVSPLQLVPEPVSVVLLLAGALMFGRRRGLCRPHQEPLGTMGSLSAHAPAGKPPVAPA